MDSMLSKALREFTAGPLNQLIVNIGGQDGSQWEEELKRFLRKEPCWANAEVARAPTAKPVTNLLDPVSTVVISGTTSKFVAKDRFVVDTDRKAKVKISYLGDNFTAWFLNGDGKTEEPITEQTLRYAKLRQASLDAPIITELGGEAKAETTLTEAFSLMEKQKNGESGALLSNGWWNIFYVRDINGVLRAVIVHWSDDGWRVNASSVEDPHRWDAGDQVFSRNSVLESSGPSAPAQA